MSYIIQIIHIIQIRNRFALKGLYHTDHLPDVRNALPVLEFRVIREHRTVSISSRLLDYTRWIEWSGRGAPHCLLYLGLG